MKSLSIIALCIPLALLSACDDKKKQNDKRTASGQVLQGTISDSMLPLDTLQSQPPLAKATGGADGGGDAAGAPDAEATDASEDGETPEDTPAAASADDDEG